MEKKARSQSDGFDSSTTPTDRVRDRAADASSLRARLESMVRAELHGPAGGDEEEIAEARVSERYLVGMLAPRKQRCMREEFDRLANGGDGDKEDGKVDDDSLPSTTLFPSSIGFTFSAASETPKIKITARWGKYEREDSKHVVNEKTGGPKKVWKRAQMEGEVIITLREGDLSPSVPVSSEPEVHVKGIIRKRDSAWVITLFLVNDQTEPDKSRDTAWVFQPELIVEAVDGAAIFLKKSPRHAAGEGDAEVRQELRTLQMLYRHELEFAVGHGVAVHAELDKKDPTHAVRITTVVIPAHDVAKVTPPTSVEIPELSDLLLDMKALGELPASELANHLQSLPKAYLKWIENQQKRILAPAENLGEFEQEARSAISNCTRAMQRIEEAILLLAKDKNAAEAFQFANRAMWLQRIRSIYAEKRRRGESVTIADVDVPANRTWYPFQLAFVLLTIPSITDLHHKDRSHETAAVADLLWFPTGGGKTEAYLGLTAYTLALRRLQGEIEGHSGAEGVAVLMRYTLRLLTIQQFQRASTLLCACESIRRDAAATGDRRWGTTPFRVGLWVGKRVTPNTTEQSDESIKQSHDVYSRSSAFGGSGTPAQLRTCPWCGSEIKEGRNIIVERYAKGRGRTILYCGDPDGNCMFGQRLAKGEGLPVVVVDEEIYRTLPSLLIATVDKFAQMPWKGEVQMLFGRVHGICPRHGFRGGELEDSDSHPKVGNLESVKTVDCAPLRPPDLIIQDELHLISGPLGSLVGLYETAIDRLCSWKVGGKLVRPKMIASTATIRRAKDQANALYIRKLDIFPPSGVDISDNFFARRRAPSQETPGRRYLGICAHGKRLKAALIRVYLTHLSAAQKLFEEYGADSDPWMTLVGYFNSMRELGGMRRLVDDDIKNRLDDMKSRGLANRRLSIVEELTSRKSSTQIPDILDQLEKTFKPKEPGSTGGSARFEPKPIDVLLATVMVSVGVDVKRLGLMVVAGQPKTTAEYIQATSRIGRTHPGIVCTVYNWARPRDLSHYERFEHYHATFYQHIEALSVTPFAARALDRGLTALLGSLIRLSSQEFAKNDGARKVERNHEIVNAAIETIVQRARRVRQNNTFAEEVRAMLKSRLDDWLRQAAREEGGRRLGYRKSADDITVGLLKSPDDGPWERFTCLESLRDVEPSVGLILNEGGMDHDLAASPAPEPAGEKS